jgi:hypothetical protein
MPLKRKPVEETETTRALPSCFKGWPDNEIDPSDAELGFVISHAAFYRGGAIMLGY